jgi:hypothetical protein
VQIRLTHIDGKLPNLALMKLAHYHGARGDEVHFTRSLVRNLFEPDYDIVYGSSVFQFNREKLETFIRAFPQAVVGGTGSDAPKDFTVEQHLGITAYEFYDYSIYPKVSYSIGFTQRGCRRRCPFCVVPTKEGRPKEVSEVIRIWRGEPWPRHVALLDNDFFSTGWERRAAGMAGFRVCLNQGVNLRDLTDEQAEVLAGLPLYDFKFRRRRIYTAWDSLREVRLFMRGVERLARYGCPPTRLLVYMLIGYEPGETDDLRLQRFNELVKLGCKPYPMPYNSRDPALRRFQRWAVTGAHKCVPFAEYDSTSHDRKRRNRRIFDSVPFELPAA